MGAAERIRDAGFKLIVEGGTLYVEPASRLTEDQRAFIRRHRDQIIAELTAANESTALLAMRRCDACGTETLHQRVDGRWRCTRSHPDIEGAPEPPDPAPQAESDRTSAETPANPSLLDGEGRTGPWVECWTPVCGRVLVKAKDERHADWLQRMNPPPRRNVIERRKAS